MSTVSARVPALRSPSSHRELQRGSGDTCPGSKLFHGRGTMSLGNPDILQWVKRHPDICPRKNHYLYHTGHKRSFPCVLEKSIISIFEGCSPYQPSCKDNPKKRGHWCLLTKCAQVQGSHGACLSTTHHHRGLSSSLPHHVCFDLSNLLDQYTR